VPVTAQQIEQLAQLNSIVPATPWTSIVEGRDQPLGGASFIQTGAAGSWGPDIYVSSDGFESNVALLDLYATLRNLLPEILDALSSQLDEQSTT
jgi:hypothetical protein